VWAHVNIRDGAARARSSVPYNQPLVKRDLLSRCGPRRSWFEVLTYLEPGASCSNGGCQQLARRFLRSDRQQIGSTFCGKCSTLCGDERNRAYYQRDVKNDHVTAETGRIRAAPFSCTRWQSAPGDPIICVRSTWSNVLGTGHEVRPRIAYAGVSV